MPVTNEPVYASKAQPWLAFYDPKYRDMPVPDCTAFEYVCRQNKGHLADIALNYYGVNITYATFMVNVKKTAAALRAAGVRKGDIMTAVSVMTPELIYLFYASDMVGATLNLVDPRYSAEGIHDYIEEAGSRMLICMNLFYDKCHQAMRRTTVEKVLVTDARDGLFLGRSQREAPDADGAIVFTAKDAPEVGSFVKVRITGAETYDLKGERL